MLIKSEIVSQLIVSMYKDGRMPAIRKLACFRTQGYHISKAVSRLFTRIQSDGFMTQDVTLADCAFHAGVKHVNEALFFYGGEKEVIKKLQYIPIPVIPVVLPLSLTVKIKMLASRFIKLLNEVNKYNEFIRASNISCQTGYSLLSMPTEKMLFTRVFQAEYANAWYVLQVIKDLNTLCARPEFIEDYNIIFAKAYDIYSIKEIMTS